MDEETTQLVSSTTEYGSTEDDDEEDYDVFDPTHSFHLGNVQKVAAANVWASMRYTESFAEYGDDYQQPPTLLKENVAILLDPNLEGKKGQLYYSKNAFYKEEEEPHYLLTVNTDIYQRVLSEVCDAKNVPLGLYYCCHGVSWYSLSHMGMSNIGSLFCLFDNRVMGRIQACLTMILCRLSSLGYCAESFSLL